MCQACDLGHELAGKTFTVFPHVPRFIFIIFLFMCMSVCVQVSRKLEEGDGFPRAGVTGGWELGIELRSPARSARALNC